MNMLLDHKAEVPYPSVDRVALLNKNDLNSGQARSFIIILSEQRSCERAGSDLPYSVIKLLSEGH